MSITKQKIETHFSNASKTYEDVAYVQKDCANLLIKDLRRILPSFTPKNVLDIGSGTGYVTELSLAQYPDAQYTLSDLSPAMINQTKEKFSNHAKFDFVVADMEEHLFSANDLVISNFAMQWTTDINATIQKFHDISKVFAFTSLTRGTFKEWYDILKNYDLQTVFKKYPSTTELTEFLERTYGKKCHHHSMSIPIKFAGVIGFFHYLKSLGADIGNSGISVDILKKLIAQYNADFIVTYEVFFCIIDNM